MKTGEIAKALGLILRGDADLEIAGIANLETARPNQIAYLDAARYLDRAGASKAGCIIVPEGTYLQGVTTLTSPHPKYHFAQLAALLHPALPAPPGVHPTALVSDSARLGQRVCVGPYALIDDGAVIGDGSTISAFCCVGRECRLGAEAHLYPRVTLYPRVQVGTRVTIHSGTVIGSDGFGYVQHEGRYVKFPQIGNVEIGDDVEIGSNVSIDRGALGTTRIGRGCKIDNLVQIAHNVIIEDDCVVAAQTGISGSARIDHHAVLAGQVGIADHVHVEAHAVVGAQGGVPSGKVIREGDFVWGTPARPMPVFKEQYGSLSRLPMLRREVLALKKKVAELEEMLKNLGPAPPAAPEG